MKQAQKASQVYRLRREDQRILMVGDLVSDRYRSARIIKVNPESRGNLLLYTWDKGKRKPGCAGNVTKNLATLGQRVVFYTTTGNDEAGRSLKQLLEDSGKVKVQRYIHHGSTIEKTRFYEDDRGSYVIRIDEENLDTPTVIPLDQERKMAESIRKACNARGDNKVAAVGLSDYSKGIFLGKNLAEEVIAEAKARNIPTVAGFRIANYRLFRGATIVSLNLQETEELTGRRAGPNLVGLEDVVTNFQRVMNSQCAVVTLGQRGIACVKEGGKVVTIKGSEVIEGDPVGAGDTIVAALLAGVANDLSYDKTGFSIVDTIDFANRAAKNVVRKKGTATTDLEEIAQEIMQEQIKE